MGASHAGSTGSAVAINNWEVDLVNICIKVHKQVLNFRNHLVDSCIRAVNFVDRQNHGQVQSQRLAQHEPCLRKRPLGCVNEQHHSVDHGERTLYFATEVGVARSVNNVDLDLFATFTSPPHSSVLGKDRDSLLSLKVGVVHDAVNLGSTFAECTRLTQHGVNQGGLTVVYVGDDGNVANALY